MDEHDDVITGMLLQQWQLQVESFGVDPRLLEGEQLMEFVRWNAYALEDELHEATSETGWKPWAASNHMNRQPYVKELVDGWCFFMNLLLAGAGDVTVEQIIQEFANEYAAKREINAQRQRDGYTGLDKCTNCHRDLKDFRLTATNGDEYCGGCGHILQMRMNSGSMKPAQ